MEEWMTKYKSLEKKYEMEMSKKTRNVSPTETRNLEY